jgi:hypothetical protein
MQCTSSEFSSPFTVAPCPIWERFNIGHKRTHLVRRRHLRERSEFWLRSSPVGRAISPYKPAKGAPHGLRIDSF